MNYMCIIYFVWPRAKQGLRVLAAVRVSKKKRFNFIFQPLLRQMLFFAGTLAQERASQKKTTGRKLETRAILVKINTGT